MGLARFANITVCMAMVFAMMVPIGAGHADAPRHNFAAQKTDDDAPSQNAVNGNAAQRWLAYYKSDQTNLDYASIRKFILAHPDFPAMGRLCTLAERAMPSDLSDADVLGWFSQFPPQTTFGMRQYAQALSNAGQGKTAGQAINDWWKKANLDTVDQAKGFIVFAQILSKDSHEERLRRLIYKGQFKDARSLAAAMGRGYTALTEARITLRTGNGNVNQWLGKVPSTLINDEGLLFDRLQWRRETDDDAGAIQILKRSPTSDEMYNAEDWGKERAIIVRRLFEKADYQGAYDLAMDHRTDSGQGFAGNEWMAGWLSLEYLNKPWDAFEHFEKLYHVVETPVNKSRAAYWAGLASEQLKHPEVATKWFTAGAKYPTTFYGQLSREKLGRTDKITVPPVTASAKMKNSALANAARWLMTNNYKSEAGLFLNKMIETSKTPQEYAAAAEIANTLSMKNFAIRAAQESEKNTGVSLLRYAFPDIEKYMGNTDVEWALVHALVRQESRYDDKAVSAAGALGLMQLMPGTAKEIARKAKMPHETDWLTSKPSHNIAVGSLYLDELLNRYNGNYAMALAAYNAGPMRVARWIPELGDPRDPKVDLVNWIEMIPISETRNYVQRVLESLYVYRQTLPRNKNEPRETSTIAAR